MRRFVTTGGLLLLAMSLATAGGKPVMKLKVSTHSGPTPLSVELSGSFTGGEPAEWSSCLVTVEWTYTTPGGSHLTSKEEMPCVDAPIEPARSGVAPAFKRTLTLKEPGIYSYRMVLVAADGKPTASASQEVKAYRGKLEVGVTGTHVTNRR